MSGVIPLLLPHTRLYGVGRDNFTFSELKRNKTIRKLESQGKNNYFEEQTNERNKPKRGKEKVEKEIGGCVEKMAVFIGYYTM
jgi:hypothetical protein